ncbi:MAG TPA: DUF1330 domain-containing protein [Bellilinea sp.]|nr:DUF1330 domain-containing protein [Bellilinea sp.]
MTAYVVVDIAVTDPELYEEVKQRTPPIVEQYGGRYLVRGGYTEALHGSWNPERLVLLSFDSLEQAKAWESSPEYNAVKQLRDRCARVNMVMVPGIR